MGPRKPHPRRLSPCEAAYIAGMVDGDGCITFAGRTGRNKDCFTLRLVVTTTSPDLAYWLYDVTEAGSVYANRPRPRRVQSYRWMVTSAQAECVIQQIIGYMVVKRRQAELALKARTFIGQKGVGRIVRRFIVQIQRLNCNRKGAVKGRNRKIRYPWEMP